MTTETQTDQHFRFFVETNPNDKMNPDQTLYSLIQMAARKIARQYGDFFKHNSSLSVDDLVNELVLFVMSRPSITINHGNSYLIIYKAGTSLLNKEKKQKGFAVASFDENSKYDNMVAEDSSAHWDRKTLREALFDWENMPPVVKNALNHKRMPPQFKDIITRRFRDNENFTKIADSVRCTSAFKRLQEFVNMPPGKSDSEFEAANEESDKFPEHTDFRTIEDI